jgi:hypothetical protein
MKVVAFGSHIITFLRKFGAAAVVVVVVMPYILNFEI